MFSASGSSAATRVCFTLVSRPRMPDGPAVSGQKETSASFQHRSACLSICRRSQTGTDVCGVHRESLEGHMKTLLLTVAFIGALTGVANSQQAPDPRIADLAQAGKIRVGVHSVMYEK